MSQILKKTLFEFECNQIKLHIINIQNKKTRVVGVGHQSIFIRFNPLKYPNQF